MPLLVIALEDVPRADAGLASGIVNVSMQVGGAVGVAVLGTIATSRSDKLLDRGEGLAVALTGGYQLAFCVGAAFAALAGLTALAALRRPA